MWPRVYLKASGSCSAGCLACGLLDDKPCFMLAVKPTLPSGFYYWIPFKAADLLLIFVLCFYSLFECPLLFSKWSTDLLFISAPLTVALDLLKAVFLRLTKEHPDIIDPSFYGEGVFTSSWRKAVLLHDNRQTFLSSHSVGIQFSLFFSHS